MMTNVHQDMDVLRDREDADQIMTADTRKENGAIVKKSTSQATGDTQLVVATDINSKLTLFTNKPAPLAERVRLKQKVKRVLCVNARKEKFVLMKQIVKAICGAPWGGYMTRDYMIDVSPRNIPEMKTKIVLETTNVRLD
jgi:hypothetical protein